MVSIIILVIISILLLFMGLYKAQKYLLPVTVISLFAAVIMAILQWNGAMQEYFAHMFVFDNFAISFTVVMLGASALIFVLTKEYFEKISNNVAEYYALLLFVLIGAICMVSFTNLSMLFIGIEILSVSLYILAGIRKHDTSSNEAALKYFLLGAFSTCFLLFGIALIYGATGTFDIALIAERAGNNPVFFTSGILLMMIAMAFKIGAAPFHFWTPDVYTGSPSMISVFMSTVVKIAGIAAFLRLFDNAFGGVTESWALSLAVIAAITLVIGNITAVFQDNFKRLLAYSSIAHAGYLVMAVVSLGENSATSILFYSIAYSAATIAAFAIMILVKADRGSNQISAFNGLSKTNPFLALVLTISMTSLAGIPLTAGFIGKFLVFNTALQGGHLWLVLLAVVTALIGIYYYFKVIIAMYFNNTVSDAVVPVNNNYKFVLTFVAIITLILGIIPGVITGII